MNTSAGEHLGVAVVDDDPIFREVVCATLRRTTPFVIFEAGSGDELLDLMDQQSIDCIVLDYDLGLETGLAVKQRLEETRPERVPVIMLTGDGRESTAIRAFRMGFADYIPKRGLQPDQVARTVSYVVERSRKVRDQEAERQRLVAASSIDSATGLEGRTRLDERLTLLAAMSAPSCSKYGLILIEIVGYEALTTRFGFKMADQALRLVAKKLASLTRSGDVCGRYENGIFLAIADVRADNELLRQICRRFADQLAMRLTSDAVDLQLMVRVGATMATPVVAGIETSGGRHPVLRSVALALEQARASGTAVIIATAISRASAEIEAVPATEDAIRVQASGSRPAAEELRSEDRRREPRHRVLRKGLIHLIGTQSTINCMVRNVSENGMRLRLEAPCALPEVFDLEVVGSGARKRVRVRWQIAIDLGVEVVHPETAIVVAR